MNPAREAALSDPAMAAAPTIDLAGLLAAFHADALTRLLLLLLRTDLADPPPRYLAELAHRAGAISSQAVCRAQLDEFTLQFLDAAIIGGLADRTPTAGDPPTDRLDAALNRLVARGLLDTTAGLRVPTETASWSAPAGLCPPSAVRRAGRPSPNALPTPTSPGCAGTPVCSSRPPERPSSWTRWRSGWQIQPRCNDSSSPDQPERRSWPRASPATVRSCRRRRGPITDQRELRPTGWSTAL
jgi:hypothetical protein